MMDCTITASDLIDFASEIAKEFNEGKIHHPIHLSDGNEEELIDAFEEIENDDWVCGSWRMHSQCLLKRVPKEELKAEIFKGNSMTLSFPKYRIVSSAIVGGILPIALGIALSIRRTKGAEMVHCFLGDMTARGGTFHECYNFADFHNLPIHWIVEDNEVSVCTPTESVWGPDVDLEGIYEGITYYRYKSKYPHAGAGIRVQF